MSQSNRHNYLTRHLCHFKRHNLTLACLPICGFLGSPAAMARAYPDVENGLITRCIMVTLPSQFMHRAALPWLRDGMIAAFLWGRTNRERKAYTLEFAIWVAEYILQSLIERPSQKVNEQSIGYDVPSSKRYPSLFDAIVPGCVKCSRTYFDPLVKRLEKAFLRGCIALLLAIILFIAKKFFL